MYPTRTPPVPHPYPTRTPPAPHPYPTRTPPIPHQVTDVSNAEVSKALSFVPEEVDPTFLAELDAASPREVEHAASKIQAVFRGHKTRANLASDRFNRPRTKKSRLRNRKHGRDPPKLRRKHGVVRRGHVLCRPQWVGGGTGGRAEPSRLGQGALFGESALETEAALRVRATDVWAEQPCELLRLPASAFRGLGLSSEDLAEQARTALRVELWGSML